jgi:hypothetical protein|tara:strand:+ start:29 stop:130 length:102 start_codon:yes stop_codon:yes gene_type:complete
MAYGDIYNDSWWGKTEEANGWGIIYYLWDEIFG